MISRRWYLSRLQIYYSVPLYPYIQISLPAVSGAAILLNPTKGYTTFACIKISCRAPPLSAYFHISNPEHNQLEKLPPCVPKGPIIYMARRGYTQHQLVSWLDAQERQVEQPVEAVNELLAEFDPLYNPPGEPDVERFLRFGQFVQNYDRVEHFIEQGRRTVRFRFLRDLESSLAAKIMSKMKQHVRTRHAIKIQTTLELRNTEDGELLEFYQARKKSGWLSTLTQTQHWVRAEEELRLQNAKLDRPNTKWVYERTLLVDVTVILDSQPLQIGLGRLPDWLRNKREVIALDIYNDNRCLHRCLAVHWGARIDRCTRKARELENNFFAAYPRLRDKLNASHLPLLEKHYKQGIAAYLVLSNGDFVLLHTPANYHKVGTPTMNIGIYNDHAFLITDINKVTSNYTCIDRCTRKARELENNFFAAYPRLRDKLNASHLPLL